MKDLSVAGWIATWGKVGLAPKAPGTMGTLAGIPFAWLIAEIAGIPGLLIATLILFFVGAWASDKYMEETGSGHDPGEIVVDEVMGIWLLMAALPHSWQGYVLGFIIFRVFDIWKPWPIAYFDKKVLGGPGVMFDDFLAALYPVVIWFLFVVLCWLTGNADVIVSISSFFGG